MLKQEWIKTMAACAGVFGSAYLLHQDIQQGYLPIRGLKEIPYSDFLIQAQTKQFSDMRVIGDTAILTDKNHKDIETILPPDMNSHELIEMAQAQNINLSFKSRQDSLSASFSSYAESLYHKKGELGILLTLGFLYFQHKRAEHVKNLRINLHDDQKLSTAYHEAGHTLLSIYCPGSNKLKSVSNVADHGYLGATFFDDLKKYRQLTKQEMYNEIIIYMGGRVAEQIHKGDTNYSIGSRHDLQQAKKIARQMIVHYGMSEELGPVVYNKEFSWLARLGFGSGLSSQKHQQIEQEMEAILKNAYKDARTVLDDHIEELHTLAKEIDRLGTLSASQIYETINAEPDVRI